MAPCIAREPLKWNRFPAHMTDVPAARVSPSTVPEAVDPGSALFDGEGFGGLAATDPEVILEGWWDDWGMLEEALAVGSGG